MWTFPFFLDGCRIFPVQNFPLRKNPRTDPTPPPSLISFTKLRSAAVPKTAALVSPNQGALHLARVLTSSFSSPSLVHPLLALILTSLGPRRTEVRWDPRRSPGAPNHHHCYEVQRENRQDNTQHIVRSAQGKIQTPPPLHTTAVGG